MSRGRQLQIFGQIGFKVATYEILVSEGLTAMAGANAAAPLGPMSLLLRLSCAHERDKGGHMCDGHE